MWIASTPFAQKQITGFQGNIFLVYDNTKDAKNIMEKINGKHLTSKNAENMDRPSVLRTPWITKEEDGIAVKMGRVRSKIQGNPEYRNSLFVRGINAVNKNKNVFEYANLKQIFQDLHNLRKDYYYTVKTFKRILYRDNSVTISAPLIVTFDRTRDCDVTMHSASYDPTCPVKLERLISTKM